jgi:hypothetical protein
MDVWQKVLGALEKFQTEKFSIYTPLNDEDILKYTRSRGMEINQTSGTIFVDFIFMKETAISFVKSFEKVVPHQCKRIILICPMEFLWLAFKLDGSLRGCCVGVCGSGGPKRRPFVCFDMMRSCYSCMVTSSWVSFSRLPSEESVVFTCKCTQKDVLLSNHNIPEFFRNNFAIDIGVNKPGVYVLLFPDLHKYTFNKDNEYFVLIHQRNLQCLPKLFNKILLCDIDLYWATNSLRYE